VDTRSGEDIVSGGNWNVRCGVYEYGGGKQICPEILFIRQLNWEKIKSAGAAIVEDGVVYFSNYAGPAYSVHKREIKRITPGQ
jgi:hypothetical protein